MSKAIVMIHGMWGGGWYWANYIEFLERRGYKCHPVTLRHHDIAPDDPPPPELGKVSLLDYVNDMEAHIKGMDEKPIVIGHSMGGFIAQALAERDLCECAVCLTPAAPSGIMALKPSVIKTFLPIMTRWGFWKKPNKLPFEKAVYSCLHLLPPNQQRQVYDRMVYESGRAAFELGFWLLDTSGASRIDESKVKCPILVVAGAEDRITPSSVVEKVARKYGERAAYKEFRNHAHWVVAEPGWEDIADYVANWLGTKGCARA
jgi:pimeloyl-ACP methyl ester carboxylesterase